MLRVQSLKQVQIGFQIEIRYGKDKSNEILFRHSFLRVNLLRQRNSGKALTISHRLINLNVVS